MKKNIIQVDNQAIGERIRKEREKLRMTREEFAEMLELSPLYIGQLERGERQMSLDTLIKVSGCLYISTDYLLHGKTSENDLEIGRINTLLNRCSKSKLHLIEGVIRQIFSYRE